MEIVTTTPYASAEKIAASAFVYRLRDLSTREGSTRVISEEWGTESAQRH